MKKEVKKDLKLTIKEIKADSKPVGSNPSTASGGARSCSPAHAG
ncbi:hypothetical protein [Treponema pedis]|nr:hypothetical protein [Treponema pedis]